MSIQWVLMSWLKVKLGFSLSPEGKNKTLFLLFVYFLQKYKTATRKDYSISIKLILTNTVHEPVSQLDRPGASEQVLSPLRLLIRSTGIVLTLGSWFGLGEVSHCDATQELGWLWGKLASLVWVGPLSSVAHNSHTPQDLKLWVGIGLGQRLGDCVSKAIRTPNHWFSGEILADFHLPRGQLLLFTENLLPEACPGSLGSQ